MSHLHVTNLSKSVGVKTLFTNVEFSLYPGERAGLIGVNGTGKSTLLSILAGDLESDTMEMDHPKKYRITYLMQEPEFDESLTVLETVFSGDSPLLALNRSYEKALQNMIADSGSEQLQEELMKIQEGMERENAWDINALAKTALTKLGIDMYDQQISELSGGQRKRVALAKALIEPADLILLDEPTNHLDAGSTEWLQETLLRMNSAMLFVTHDRYFLDAVSTHIFELADQTMYTHKGNYGDYLEARAVREEMAEATKQKMHNRFRSRAEMDPPLAPKPVARNKKRASSVLINYRKTCNQRQTIRAWNFPCKASDSARKSSKGKTWPFLMATVRFSIPSTFSCKAATASAS